MRCALFRPKSQWLRFQPREGLRVLARGRLTLYEPRGDYQLVLDTLEEAGEGALRRAFDELKARLAAEGLFDAARKRPLPAFPRRLAVITSPTGAVIRDIASVLGRRFPLLEVELLPAQVQGATAAAQIAALLRAAGASGRYDAILVARGGGSLEDLWAFNDEALARAIAASPVPVVSAVGHETDVTLADFAADLRAPTPSAAAELLVPDARDLDARLRALELRLGALQRQHLRALAQRADQAALRLDALRPQARLHLLRQRLLDAGRRLDAGFGHLLGQRQARLQHAAVALRAHQPARRLPQLGEHLAALARRARAATAARLRQEELRVQGLARSLEAVSPLATVARGYSILTDEEGRVLRSVAQTEVGMPLRARLADGRLQLRVEGSAAADGAAGARD